jgi:hypothetical protein
MFAAALQLIVVQNTVKLCTYSERLPCLVRDKEGCALFKVDVAHNTRIAVTSTADLRIARHTSSHKSASSLS